MRFIVHFKRPKSGRLKSVSVEASDMWAAIATASAIMGKWFTNRGYLLYGVTEVTW